MSSREEKFKEAWSAIVEKAAMYDEVKVQLEEKQAELDRVYATMGVEEDVVPTPEQFEEQVVESVENQG